MKKLNTNIVHKTYNRLCTLKSNNLLKTLIINIIIQVLKHQLALKDNNAERLEKEILRLKELLVESKGKEREMQSCISDLRFNIADLEAQVISIFL